LREKREKGAGSFLENRGMSELGCSRGFGHPMGQPYGQLIWDSP